MHDLVIGVMHGTHSKEIHKLTWCSPNGKDQNQIDNLMVNGTWRHSLLDVKIKRGADVGSDHHLVTAVLRVKLRKTGSRKESNSISKSCMTPRSEVILCNN